VDRSEPVNEPGSLGAALERGITREFIEARLAVEVEVARLAARRRSDEDLEQLQEALAEQERRLVGQVDALIDHAANFNVVLAEAAHNEVFVALVQSFVGMMVERGDRLYAIEGFPEWDLGEHRGLYEAVRDQDEELAGERMRTHINALAQYYVQTGAA
jgi:GntR family transcriptional regulator, transcriptional repressor for pyruvate dehydrogenase complex